jgi:N-acetylmuramoyl-L-alanine amidase
MTPNFDDRPEGTAINTIVYHYTGMRDVQEAIDRLCDPESKVSAHYVIDEDGEILQLVDEEKRAWHAGVSSWRGKEGVNAFSIGLEIVNPGHEFGYEPFPIRQIESVVRLSQEIMERHPIENRNIVGHSDVAPGRKQDPGELFPWKILAEEGVGLWPDVPLAFEEEMEEYFLDYDLNIEEMQQALKSFGYGLNVTGEMDIPTKNVIKAFQRHFLPAYISGRWGGRENYILERIMWQLT